MALFRAEVHPHWKYGWQVHLWLCAEEGETHLGREECLTRWGARLWARRRARSLTRTARRESRDRWSFEI